MKTNDNSENIFWVDQGDEYNKWHKEALGSLLGNLAGRIENLRSQFYVGCGFHHELEKELGDLIQATSLPWHSWGRPVETVWQEHVNNIIVQFRFEALCEMVNKAEQSAVELAMWG